MCVKSCVYASITYTPCVLCRSYKIVSADDREGNFDEMMVDDRGMFDIGELFGHLDDQPCTEESIDNRNCVSAAYGVNDEVPKEYDHGNGEITRVSLGLRRRRRQTQQTYVNVPLRPESTYCLFVAVEIASGVPDVSKFIVFIWLMIISITAFLQVTLTRYAPLACPVSTSEFSYSFCTDVVLTYSCLLVFCTTSTHLQSHLAHHWTDSGRPCTLVLHSPHLVCVLALATTQVRRLNRLPCVAHSMHASYAVYRDKYNEVGTELYAKQQYPLEEKRVLDNNIYEQGELPMLYRGIAFDGSLCLQEVEDIPSGCRTSPPMWNTCMATMTICSALSFL